MQCLYYSMMISCCIIVGTAAGSVTSIDAAWYQILPEFGYVYLVCSLRMENYLRPRHVDSYCDYIYYMARVY